MKLLESKHGTFKTMLTHPAFTLGCLKNLLIQEEWKKNWIDAQAAEAEKMDSFIIIGHPGIDMCFHVKLVQYPITGKMLSLYYFLALCVAQGFPTFSQNELDYFFSFIAKELPLFTTGGTGRI
jgi:hypothetical protein